MRRESGRGQDEGEWERGEKGRAGGVRGGGRGQKGEGEKERKRGNDYE